ncbi:hypothetical protein BJX68DRAFT_258999 [Aspergillus pseudodeflectus]|uniref:NWD NACHT-NTPase N-terminal domain-containing protein n=1 Tax=Aspergillus pseudodeflectus TaxID=176178 RepID=A0ABR4JIS9_9EURO
MPRWEKLKGSFKKHITGTDGSSKKKDGHLAELLFDPWLQAQQLIKKDKALNKIWEKSIHILKSRLGLKYEEDGSATRVNDFRTFLDAIAQRLDNKKWSVLDDIGRSNTREKLTKVCRNIILVKDVISPAAATSPPAAIACAGITVGLLLFIQAMEQHETLLQGLDTISSIIPRLHVIDHHFLREPDIRPDLRGAIEKDMIQLCSKVLEFQSRAICYLEKQTARQFLTDMIKQDGWDGILQDIERYYTSIKDATSSVHILEVVRKLEALQDDVQQIQKANLFQRLYTCPYKDRKDRNNKRVPGTCEWFTNHPQFTKWNQSGNSELLWVSADPGSDEYLPSGTRTRRATDALTSILRQLLIAQPHLTSGDQLAKSFNELWSILAHVTADENAGEVICLFDVLDECQDDDRTRLIQAIESLFLNKLGKRNLKFLMTSRPYDHIRRDFFKLEKSLPTIHLSGENEKNTDKISGEIDLVIKERVRDISERNSLRLDEFDFIIDQLTSVPNRTYLWVSLALEVITKIPGFTKGNVRQAIHDIPENVNAAYTRILDRSPDHSRAKRLLHIVTAAEPLAFDEILNDDERIQTMIRGLCGLFLVVIDRKVYLLHQTAKEFLVRQSLDFVREDVKAGTWKHSLYPEESHYVLAEICTLYLSQDTTRDLFPGLMDYAAKNWAAHVRRASVSSNDTVAKRGRTLCRTNSTSDDILLGSYLGLIAVAQLILEAGEVDLDSKDPEYDVESKDFNGRTPLSWAAENGHEGVVQLLLETGKVDVDSKDSEYGRTPLSWAAIDGHEGVVELLLEMGTVDADSKDSNGRTPLFWAASGGHEGVVKLLLETGKNGEERVVRLLLETGKVKVESKDSNGYTLSWAAENGSEEIAKLLEEASLERRRSQQSVSC